MARDEIKSEQQARLISIQYISGQEQCQIKSGPKRGNKY